ncbi:MAG: metallophosphoesterase [Clostridia bacterium]|nr:metallophosphoesterase [Clostridia bacterium]
MAIYTISDLHLSLNKEKPMDIFGENWTDHSAKIKSNWQGKVTDSDVVLMPGDFSWAMNLKDTYDEFKYLEELPGKKILLKGNHDYWWETITKMRNYLEANNFESIDFLHNNSYLYENIIIAGTRGWIINDELDDKKIFERELGRLELSIEDGIKKYGEEKDIIVCMHYPPIINKDISESERKLLNILKKYNVKKCIYGHLHGESQKYAITGCIEGIEFILASADYLEFELLKIK